MKKVAGFLLIICVPFLIHAQLLSDKVMPPSPNAAAIIKYCDHPVGTASGIPKIRLPLSTLFNKDAYVPISMNYHTLGIKVEEEATWTGLGWYLSSGGMITRIVRGKNDFGQSETELKSTAKGYPFESIKPCFDDCEDQEVEEFRRLACNGEIDSDPDVFFFDILGMKGKFLLTPGHDPKADKVELNMVKPTKMTFTYFIKAKYWQVKDLRGYTYEFRTRELTETHRNYIDYKADKQETVFNYYSDLATTSWYLDKITSPSGSIAWFTYEIGTGGNSPYGSNSTYHRMNINDQDVWDIHYSSHCFPDDKENVLVLSESQHNDIYLKSIRCGDFEAKFFVSDREDIISPSIPDRASPAGSQYSQYLDVIKGPQKLDSIVVTKGGQSHKRFLFKYSYFNGDRQDPIPRMFKRLKLDSLVSIGKDEKREVSKFEYFEKDGLPSKESYGRDLWGYANGEEDARNITPSDFFNYSQPEKILQQDGRTKHYDLEKVKEGVMTKIEYGNGVIKTFKYGHQEFTKIDEEITSHFDQKVAQSNFKHTRRPFIFGGLRLVEVIEKYPTDEIYKEYDYRINRVESGVLKITHYSHDHHGYGHRTSGNHNVVYKKVYIKSGKIFNGHRF